MDYNKCVFDSGPCSIQSTIIKHVLACARDEICRVRIWHTVYWIRKCSDCIGKGHGLVHMKRGLALSKLWIMNNVVMCWSSFDTAYHHKTRSGSCQGRNMQSLRFTHICCTSMNVVRPCLNYGLWKVIVFVGLRSIPRIIIKHVLAAARDEICKVLDLHTFS